MANTPSAKKRVRQIQRKTEVNKARRSRIKTFVRMVEASIQSNKNQKNQINEQLRILVEKRIKMTRKKLNLENIIQ